LGAEPLTVSPLLPELLARLAGGCLARLDPPAGVDARVPLDAGARAVLEGAGPPRVSAGELTGGAGARPLARWLLALALALMGIESLLRRRRAAAAAVEAG